jgi:hypothetical protein
VKKWVKSSDALSRRFEAALPKHPDLQPRKMFGYPCCFVKGVFFTGLHEEKVVMRLPDEVKAQLPALDGAAAFDPMGGRPMKQWWVVPPSIIGDAGKLSALIADAFGRVQPLPGKAAKPGAAKGKPARASAARPASPRRKRS